MGDIRRRLSTVALAATVALSVAQTAMADGLAVDDGYPVAEDAPEGLVVPVETGVLANDTGGSLALCVLSFDTTGLQGTLQDPGVAPDGSFTYLPPSNFNGTTTFSYTVATKAGEACPSSSEGTGTVTITVTPVNDAPTAVADSFSALKDRTLTIGAPGVLVNDSDVDGDSLSAVKVNSPAHGALTLAADGGFSYTPANGYVGPDAFSYRASDGELTSPTRVVSLTVSAIPPPPTPTPAPTPTPVAPTPSPEPSPSESPLPSDSGLPSPTPVDTGILGSASPEPTPDAGPVAGQGGLPLAAVGALALLFALLGVAAFYFVRSQRNGDDDGYGPDGGVGAYSDADQGDADDEDNGDDGDDGDD